MKDKLLAFLEILIIFILCFSCFLGFSIIFIASSPFLLIIGLIYGIYWIIEKIYEY